MFSKINRNPAADSWNYSVRDHRLSSLKVLFGFYAAVVDPWSSLNSMDTTATNLNHYQAIYIVHKRLVIVLIFEIFEVKKKNFHVYCPWKNKNFCTISSFAILRIDNCLNICSYRMRVVGLNSQCRFTRLCFWNSIITWPEITICRAGDLGGAEPYSRGLVQISWRKMSIRSAKNVEPRTPQLLSIRSTERGEVKCEPH